HAVRSRAPRWRCPEWRRGRCSFAGSWLRSRGGGARPQHALIHLHSADSLVREPLDALALERLARVEIALRVDSHVVRRIDLAGLSAAVAEAGDRLERRAVEHPDLLVHAVGDVEVLLLRVARERDVPRRAASKRRRRDDFLFYIRAVRFENLNTI